MKLTTKGRYAVTAMLDLALHGDQGPVSLADISARQEISLSYLEQLFSRLRRQKLVVSIRGPGGGYRLSRPAAELYIAEVVDAVSESLDTTRCGNKGDCQNGEKCLTHHLWSDLSDQIHQFLSEISLGDLMRKHEIRQVADRQNRRQSDNGSETINTERLSDQAPA
ncbi:MULTISPECIES: Fe-S cluster assembly transcriptional regulator IscR [Marinobacter]|jgi:Rrf2 family iron-sulfur cluster assembly transcriptional regulator|uniref:Fe-S cluster assembly transcriptional regulator IscR n=1 Tax=Marinobacter TaxID=2742 RepID=UPI0007D8DFCD|nr:MULTISPECIES: Fe-S cluster assembly transcriptional regulator IscR [Marinobacter]MBL3824213.1 Fe-S cluster assembly transcriptional regulator IscR [Marinobacter sp. MC3]MBL3892695.1 Fe-S cluster assembly transcriptional regulator IscR [Marinobacter sp. MW3]MCD1647490.1 Fe-S cluster assembly transcriptional regulator IscR [Marinobacter adhaerens]OAN92573.1 Fe-S cluster assembly transcriptional regulator IscR [Marinobacter sp. EhN04]OAN95108.1 Fe-S cluster assembly transcriptional regulator I|eukprot:gnl/TRDRNA2_/TRDRNA2_164091_c6_seq1.p1 gnl/TRDRNA2_/TRDRNA2_164091_c6~~gnl/TRDRNA2_/TRDRNA2_164091_c6_seq1.p1  ORF type:complete len:166 (-),score=18.76 gnl/TRDRNA2_/TRDRNA2_164091_c6_seq1:250-747(-)